MLYIHTHIYAYIYRKRERETELGTQIQCAYSECTILVLTPQQF